MLDLHATLATLRAGVDLTHAEMMAFVTGAMQGVWADEDLAAVLLALREKGESSEELAGAASALRGLMRVVRTRHERLADTCGTGGDGRSTFNISTAAAFVTAAAGLPVAKHGNRGVSSRSGSADVLQVLGVRVDAPIEVVERCLDVLGLAYCNAPLWHSAVKSVAPLRAKLKVPTIFNWLGPLCNPARAPYQLLGVGRGAMRRKVAEALHRLGTQRAAVVTAESGLDEVSLEGPTQVSLVTSEGIEEQTWTSEHFGIPAGSEATLGVSGPVESAEVVLEVLRGERGPAFDIVVLNAAACLWVAGVSASPVAAAEKARDAVLGGQAVRLLRALVQLSNQDEN